MLVGTVRLDLEQDLWGQIGSELQFESALSNISGF